MKKILLILFLSLFFISFSYAGGDDRDDELPLNSLNEVAIETLNFLQESEPEVIESNQVYVKEVIQPKLNIQVEDDISQNIPETRSNSSVESKTQKYFKSDQGILIMLILFVVGLILLFNFFVREKNN